MAKEVLTAKLATRTLDRLEKYADREGISKSEAADRMIKQGLDVEESDMRLVPVRSDGGTIIEDELNNLQSDIDELTYSSKHLSRLAVLIGLTVVWIGIETSIGMPSLVVFVTGPILMVGLIVQYLLWYRGSKV